MPVSSSQSNVQSNIQIIRSIYEAAQRGDLPAVLSFVAPDAVAVEADSLPYAGTYHGPEGFGRLLTRVFQSWRSFEFEIEQYLDAGDYVVASMRAKIGLKASGQDVPTTIAEFWKLRDGKVIELRPYYWDTAALLGNSRA